MTRGNLYECLKWDGVLENITENERVVIRSLAQEGHNYCRNPMNFRSEPWCYVLANISGLLQTSFQFCDIPICGRITLHILTHYVDHAYNLADKIYNGSQLSRFETIFNLHPTIRIILSNYFFNIGHQLFSNPLTTFV